MTHSAHVRPVRPSSVGHTTSGQTPNSHTTLAGTRIPSADLHARRIAREAGVWREFASERTRMLPPTLDAKALGSCAFSVLHRASSLAVPSKLVGTSRHQPALRALLGAEWTPLDLDARGDYLVVLHRGRVLGRVQDKHLLWIRPLVPFGLTVTLSRVTGGAPGDRAMRGTRYRLGCNVVFGHVGDALARRADATTGGDGAPPTSGASGHLRLVVPEKCSAPDPLSVRILPEREALSGDPDDIVLWRTLEGEAHASVSHVVRHSPTGIEWGYLGSGPADLALSVLTALTDEQTARALYQRFKAEVVARVPEAGGVFRAAEVRAWAARAQEKTGESDPGQAA